MNKLYFVIPLVALIAFGGYWYSFKTTYEAKAEAARIEAVHQREAKAEQDKQNREKAIAEAVAMNAKRKADREAKEAREKKEREDRSAAIDARDKARSDEIRLKSQYDRLSRDIADVKDEISKIELDAKGYASERDFVKQYIAKVRENLKNISAVGDKIEKADDVIRRDIKELTALKAKSS